MLLTIELEEDVIPAARSEATRKGRSKAVRGNPCVLHAHGYYPPMARNPRIRSYEPEMGLPSGATFGGLRRFGQVAAAVVLVGLALASGLLFMGAVHRSHQGAKLRSQGVPVNVTVTSCLGQQAGSGPNVVAYTCRGSFDLGGHSYSEVLPGLSFQPTGATIRMIALPDDPGTLATPFDVFTGRVNRQVYVLPAAFAGAVVVGILLTLITGLYRRRI
jgi:hypothetical protein